MEVAVVIPTYNERDNIERLVQTITALPKGGHIIIVDDNSPDGTGEVADRLCKEYPHVAVLHRAGKGGRGSACIAGFRRALAQGVDYIIEMDADFSHDPREIPNLLRETGQYDMVIGSRYARESKITGWPIRRRVFSKLANLYARMVLGIPIGDYTNGFRCYRRTALACIEFDRIGAKGYIVLSETAYQLFRKGFAIGEVPTTFVNRKRGESNLSLTEIANAFTSVLQLRLSYK